MNILFLDTETYCETPIKHGVHRYAEDVEIMIASFAFNDDPVTIEDFSSAERIQGLVDAADLVVIHQSGFDRTVLRHALGVEIPLEKTHDTMARALAHGLPGSLDKLCTIFKVPVDEAKDKAGKQLIQLFCKPRPKNQKLRRATRETHPVEWARFREYAGLDITAMRYLYRKLPRWNYQGAELELWRLDQRTNELGVAVDLELADAAIAAIAATQKDLAKRTRELTNGEVQKATQRDAMLKHILAEYGVELPDMKAGTLERRVEDVNLPWALRELLAIRLQASTTSTAKYKALFNAASSDGRLRGALQFCGASRTGRWSGRLFQPQNLPRPNLKAEDIALGIEALKAGCADLLYENPMELISNAVRGLLICGMADKLVISDLSNIEGRCAAWLAGETWKNEAFKRYDEGTGHDLYKVAYAAAFNMDAGDVGKDQRQIGKVMELALGYEGGVGAFVTFALVYNMDLEELAEIAYPLLPRDVRESAEGMLAWRRKKRMTTYELPDKVFVVCEAFKAMWRTAHGEISSYWKEMEQAAIKATLHPGVTIAARKISFRRDGAWLRMILPSGRSLCYAHPSVRKNKLHYYGVHHYTRRWQELGTYGGKLFENACQAVARDQLAHGMMLADAAGYKITLTVHDEIISETPDRQDFNHQHLSELMATNAPWAEGLPLAAAGFETYRYRKD